MGIIGLVQKVRDPWLRVMDGPDFNGTPCWIWTGRQTTNGYGRLVRGKRKWRAHRWTWTFFNGPIPDGMAIDHLYRRRLCCNPWHMDIVPASVNTTRRWLTDADSQHHCHRGHPRIPVNRYVRPDGRDECLPCKQMIRRDDYLGLR